MRINAARTNRWRGALWVAAWAFASGPVVAQLPPIVFVSRSLDREPDPQTRQTAMERAQTGELLLLEPGGEPRALLDGTAVVEGTEIPADVADPDVSMDGQRIVFAGYSLTDEAWRIFESRADGSELRQLSRSDRVVDLSGYGAAADAFRDYDDVDPCYLPDGRICFVSTRSPGAAPDGRVRSTNLYVMGAHGENPHRITSERFGADTPTIEPMTGRIVYSRFWRTAPFRLDGATPAEPIIPGSPGYEQLVFEPSELPVRGLSEAEFPGVNSWFLASIRPDGTELAMWAGSRLDREVTQAYRPSFLASGEALALFLPVTPLYGFPRGYGLRRFRAGPGAPVPLGGPQVFPRRFGSPPPVNFLYASAVGLDDGWLLVAAAPAAEPLSYGLYLQGNTEEVPVRLYDRPGTMELDAVVLRARPGIPVLPDVVTSVMSEEVRRSPEEALEVGGDFTFLCENIFFNAPVDVPVANAPPIGTPLSIEFFLNSQRDSTTGGDLPLLMETVRIPPSGRVEVQLPAGAALFELLRRPDGSVAVGRDGQIFHVAGANFGRRGEVARCVGCHAGHSQMPVPEDPTWTNVAPSALVSVSSQRSFGRLNLQDFRASNLVDRRTGSPDLEWAAGEGEGPATVELRWNASVRAREVVIHGTAHGAGVVGPRNQVIRGLELATFLRRQRQQTVDLDMQISPGGTAVPLDPQLEIDALEVTIQPSRVTGLYEGREGVALAEVELVAQVIGEPVYSFIRGDADCNLRVNVADPVGVVRSLFGSGAFCCSVAADADGSETVDVTDVLFLVDFLFRDGDLPPPPSACGPRPAEILTCDDMACP